MSKIDYQVLRAKAEKATCGVWSLEYGEGRFDGDDALIHREAAGYIPICRIEGAHPESGFDEDFQIEQQANAEFIAAANPATVLALLDENERLCRELIARNGEIEGLRKWAEELEAREVALPVASCIVEDGEMCIDGFGEYVGHSLPDGRHELYAAPPMPTLQAALERLRTIVADPRALPRRKEWVSGQQYSYVLLENVEAMVDEACRTAMLKGDKS
ncbi:ead/Ea22-like family protein [Escherichia coli]|uniref:ead/Ea22-like family protein n=1 Tax=Escherichia coli TaxID=562 RepID=UPI003075F864